MGAPVKENRLYTLKYRTQMCLLRNIDFKRIDIVLPFTARFRESGIWKENNPYAFPYILRPNKNVRSSDFKILTSKEKKCKDFRFQNPYIERKKV